MILPGRATIQNLVGGRELWKAFEVLSVATPEIISGTWIARDGSGADFELIPIFPGTYIRHGREVKAVIGLKWPVTAGTQTARVTGLPLTCDTRNNHAVVIYVTTCGIAMTGAVIAGTTSVQFFKSDGTSVTNAELSGKHVGFLAIYFTA